MINIGLFQRLIVFGICLLGILLALPNVLPKSTSQALPDFLPSQSMNLGLDLQGGAHLLVEVDTGSALAGSLENLAEALRRAMRENRIRVGQIPIQERGLAFQIRDAEQAELAADVIDEVVGDFSPGGGIAGPVQQYRVEQTSPGRFRVTLTENGVQVRRDRAVDQTIEILRRRIDELGLREASVQRQGEDRIVIQLPGEENPEEIIELIQKQAKMTFHLVEEGASASPDQPAPPGTMWVPMQDQPQQQLLVERQSIVTGENLVDSQQAFDRGQPVVSFRFDAVGGSRFAEITSENIGRRFAIVLDGEVVSAPVIRSAILGGAGQIEGGFTVQSAESLAALLRSGALPAEIQVIEERTVGPGLGQDSIEAGKMASILGMVFVVVFMVLSYGRFGLMADVALVLNLILIAGALSILQATLTLPGIAGIVLTIGMAVDANVLIFERIREESAAGRPPINAVDAGYRRALTTIIDSNLTTFIAAILLFLFGTGPIKGFAVTLSIGLATSMFTAIMVTRLMVVMWLRRARPAELVV